MERCDKTFEEALAGLRKGEYWARRNWHTHGYVMWTEGFQRPSYITQSRSSSAWTVITEDITASDWFCVQGVEIMVDTVTRLRGNLAEMETLNSTQYQTIADLMDKLDAARDQRDELEARNEELQRLVDNQARAIEKVLNTVRC